MLKFTKRDKETFLDRRWRLNHMYWIRAESKKLQQFKFNHVQEMLFSEAEKKNFRGIREMDLKGRKLGVSTFWEIFYLDDTMMVPNTNTGIIAHRKDDVQKLFRIVKLAYKHCPKTIVLESGREWHKPEASYDNKNELVFDGINSTIYVALDVRGGTPNNLHISEAAHISDPDRIKASLGSVPSIEFGSNITIESTANGMGDWFQETYTDAENGNNHYKDRFFPWFIDPKHSINPPVDFKPTPDELKLVEKVIERYGVTLSHGQIYWYRLTKYEQRNLMLQEFPTFREEAFLFAGNLVFDEEAVRSIVPKNPLRVWEGLNIWHEPKPNRQYIMGVDPSEGVGGDFSVIEIFDKLTLEQVAEFYNNETSPGDLARLVDKFGRFYNNALAVVESNNHGGTVLDNLKYTYPNIFFNVVLDERLNRKTKKLGWWTKGGPGGNRDLILDEFEELVFNKTVRINSGILKSELMTFVTDENGKRQAKTGKHDDTILASAIALKVARMPRTSIGVFALH